MGVTLAKLISNSKTVSLAYEGDQITFTYFPARVTEKVITDMSSFLEAEDATSLMDGFHSFNETMVHLIKSWNIFEDEAETIMFPLEAERVSELPIQLRMQMFHAIMADIRPEVATPQPMKNGR